MKRNKKILIASMMLCSISFNLSSQIYKRGIGLKMGGYSGYVGVVTKEFLNQRMSMENSIMVLRPRKESRCLSLQSLLQVNQQIGNSASMYVSVGPNFTFKQIDINPRITSIKESTLTNKINISLNTFIGIEKRIENSNLFFSFDTGPSLHFKPKPTVKYMLNFSIKYTIKHIGFKPHYNLAKMTYRKWNRV